MLYDEQMSFYAKIAEKLPKPACSEFRQTYQSPESVDLLWENVISAHPEVGFSMEPFANHVCDMLGREQFSVSDFANVHLCDLFLAAACGAHAKNAIETFETSILSRIPLALARTGASAVEVDETLQHLREHLFVDSPERRGRIYDYSGRGPLYSWTRTAAVRSLHNSRRKRHREVHVSSDELWEQILPSGDAELVRIKTVYRERFQESLSAAVASLTTRQRILLKQYFVDGLASEQIAALYRVHRATASRWIVTAQESLVEATRGHLMSELRITPDELTSVLRLIESRFEGDLANLLSSADDKER